MIKFEPDYRFLEAAARNQKPGRLPLYDHIIDTRILEKASRQTFSQSGSNLAARRNYWQGYIRALRSLGYDAVIYEGWTTAIFNQSKSLRGIEPGPIQTWDDLNKFPWDDLPDKFWRLYEKDFDLLSEIMPEGMKAVGGIGNGVFECVQDCVRYSELCILMFEHPDLYQAIIDKVGKTLLAIWKKFLKNYSDSFCVLRFGDDLGFKTNTLISAGNIRELIIPQYKRIIDLVHSYNKPFLLHSCGNIFNVMDDLIDKAGIDAKHSNEDGIAPFSTWVDKYSKRIGLFGGIDMNVLVMENGAEIKKYVWNVIDYAITLCGFACGSGNSIPDYVPPQNYRAMCEAVNEYRGTAI